MRDRLGRQGLAKAVKAAPRGPEGNVAGDDDELLASVAPYEVLRPNGAREPQSHLAKNGVTGEVTVRVVDGFEVVDVEEDNRERGVVTYGKRTLQAKPSKPFGCKRP